MELCLPFEAVFTVLPWTTKHRERYARVLVQQEICQLETPATKVSGQRGSRLTPLVLAQEK